MKLSGNWYGLWVAFFLSAFFTAGRPQRAIAQIDDCKLAILTLGTSQLPIRQSQWLNSYRTELAQIGNPGNAAEIFLEEASETEVLYHFKNGTAPFRLYLLLNPDVESIVFNSYPNAEHYFSDVNKDARITIENSLAAILRKPGLSSAVDELDDLRVALLALTKTATASELPLLQDARWNTLPNFIQHLRIWAGAIIEQKKRGANASGTEVALEVHSKSPFIKEFRSALNSKDSLELLKWADKNSPYLLELDSPLLIEVIKQRNRAFFLLIDYFPDFDLTSAMITKYRLDELADQIATEKLREYSLRPWPIKFPGDASEVDAELRTLSTALEFVSITAPAIYSEIIGNSANYFLKATFMNPEIKETLNEILENFISAVAEQTGKKVPQKYGIQLAHDVFDGDTYISSFQKNEPVVPGGTSVQTLPSTVEIDQVVSAFKAQLMQSHLHDTGWRNNDPTLLKQIVLSRDPLALNYVIEKRDLIEGVFGPYAQHLLLWANLLIAHPNANLRTHGLEIARDVLANSPLIGDLEEVIELDLERTSSSAFDVNGFIALNKSYILPDDIRIIRNEDFLRGDFAFALNANLSFGIRFSAKTKKTLMAESYSKLLSYFTELKKVHSPATNPLHARELLLAIRFLSQNMAFKNDARVLRLARKIVKLQPLIEADSTIFNTLHEAIQTHP